MWAFFKDNAQTAWKYVGTWYMRHTMQAKLIRVRTTRFSVKIHLKQIPYQSLGVSSRNMGTAAIEGSTIITAARVIWTGGHQPKKVRVCSFMKPFACAKTHTQPTGSSTKSSPRCPLTSEKVTLSVLQRIFGLASKTYCETAIKR